MGLFWLVLIGGTTTLVAGISVYYTLFVKKRPRVTAGNPHLRSFVEEHLPLLKDAYAPSPLYFEGRLQTILGLVYRDTKGKFPYQRELFSLKDGGEIALDFAKAKDDEGLVVLFFPGLTSSSQTCYVKTLVSSLNKSVGATVVVLNYRGLGGVPYKTPRTHSASSTDDAAEVIAYLREKKFPGRRMMAVGTSLGAMVLSKYIISFPEEAVPLFEAAVLVSIPWDAHGGISNLETDFLNRHLINKQLTKSLVNLVKKFMKTVDAPPGVDVLPALKAKTVREFDALVTAPQFGFPSVEAYYDSATIKGQVAKYPLPIFCLNATDDPMCPPKDLPYTEAGAPDSKLVLVTTDYGGHLGFLEGVGKNEVHFMERFVVQAVAAVASHGEKLKKSQNGI